MTQQHWVVNPSTSPECGCGWLPPLDDDYPIDAVEKHVAYESWSADELHTWWEALEDK